jgi:rhamnosyltransferase
VIFPRHGLDTSASMGLEYLAKEAGHIARHHPLTLPRYVLYTAMKTLGTIAGHFAERLPRRLARQLSLHRYHWAER